MKNLTLKGFTLAPSCCHNGFFRHFRHIRPVFCTHSVPQVPLLPYRLDVPSRLAASSGSTLILPGPLCRIITFRIEHGLEDVTPVFLDITVSPGLVPLRLDPSGLSTQATAPTSDGSGHLLGFLPLRAFLVHTDLCFFETFLYCFLRLPGSSLHFLFGPISTFFCPIPLLFHALHLFVLLPQVLILLSQFFLLLQRLLGLPMDLLVFLTE